MTIFVLGIDPGNPAGAGLVKAPDSGPVELLGYWQSQRGADVLEFIRDSVIGAAGTADAIYAPMSIHTCHEGQFIPWDGGRGSNGRAKAVSALKTARRAGEWRYACWSMGWNIYDQEGQEGVQAQRWRSDLGGPGRMPAKQWETWAVERVKILYKVELKKSWHHAADAILIATWAADRIRMEAK